MDEKFSKTNVKNIIESYKELKDTLDSLQDDLAQKRKKLDEKSSIIESLKTESINIKKQITFINKLINRSKYNTLEIKLEENERHIQDNKNEYEKIKTEIIKLNKKVNQHIAIIGILENQITDQFPNGILNAPEETIIEDSSIITKVRDIEDIIEERTKKIEKLRNKKVLTDVGLFITNIEVTELYKQFYIKESNDNKINQDALIHDFLVNYGVSYDSEKNKFYLISDNKFINNITSNNNEVDESVEDALYFLINKVNRVKSK